MVSLPKIWLLTLINWSLVLWQNILILLKFDSKGNVLDITDSRSFLGPYLQMRSVSI